MIYQSIATIALGLITGIIYASSFVLQQRGFLFSPGIPLNRAAQLLLFVGRICILGVCFYYLLRSPLIPSILAVVAFVITFWTIILVTVKARSHE